MPPQLPALVSTQRRLKAQGMKERLLDINPALVVHEKVQFVEVDDCDRLVAAGRFDYIIDCIDRCVCVTASTGVCVCVRARARACACACVHVRACVCMDHVIDCTDSLQPKLHLMKAALAHSTPIVSSMGAGGKIDPAKVILCDVSETDTDPLAAFIRQRLRKQVMS